MSEAALAEPGHNLPEDPAEIMRDNLAEKHGDLTIRRDELLEAFERAPQSVEDEGTAKKVSDFIKQLSAAGKSAEGLRVKEKEPHLAAGRICDGWFKGVTEPLSRAKTTMNARLTAFLRAKEEAERRARKEEERKAREAAEQARREADEAAARVENEADLTEAIAADEARKLADEEAARAKALAEAKAAELSRTRSDYGSVGSLRAHWTGEVSDRAALDLEALRQHIPEDGLEKAVRAFVKAGGRELRGAYIYEKKEAVVR